MIKILTILDARLQSIKASFLNLSYYEYRATYGA